MRKSTVATQFIQELAVLLDQNVVHTIDEVHNHIQRKDVIDWLEKEHPIESSGIDFSLFQSKDRTYIHDHLESLWEARAGDERRKWGIENNGICLLISWTTEQIRHDFGKDDML